MRKSDAWHFATGFMGLVSSFRQKTGAQDMCFSRRTGEFSQIIDLPGKRIRR
jgi:hypothetical protein